MTSINYTLIDTPGQLRSVESDLLQSSSLGISLQYDDIHNYELQLSLLQVSTSNNIYLIDIQNVDISGLGPIFADPNTIKLFFSGFESIRLLQTIYGWNIRSIVDLETIYSFIKESDGDSSLAEMIESILDFSLANYRQPVNWLERPLPESLQQRAAQNVSYLHRALVQMQKRLTPEQQRVLEVYFLQYPLSENRTETPLMYAFQLCHDYNVDDHPTRLLIYRLIEFREMIGKEHNVGAQAVLSADQLRFLVSRKPTTIDGLRKHGLFEDYIEQYHQQILELIKDTVNNPSKIDPEGTYAELDAIFKKYFPYHNHLNEDYEWSYDISLSTYRNRRGVLRIIYDMIDWKVEDTYMPYLITESLQHQLAVNESIRLDLLRPKIDACKSLDDVISFVYKQVELIYAML